MSDEKSFFDKAKDFASNLGEDISEGIEKAGDFIEEKLGGDSHADAASDAASSAGDAVSDAASSATDAVSDAASSAGDAVSDAVDAAKGAVSDATDGS